MLTRICGTRGRWIYKYQWSVAQRGWQRHNFASGDKVGVIINRLSVNDFGKNFPWISHHFSGCLTWSHETSRPGTSRGRSQAALLFMDAGVIFVIPIQPISCVCWDSPQIARFVGLHGAPCCPMILAIWDDIYVYRQMGELWTLG